MTAPLIALAQITPRKADYAENLRRIGHVFSQIAVLQEPPDVVVFPETMTSGYFLEGGVRESAVTTGTLLADLAVVHQRTGAPPVDIVVGFYEEYQNDYYNSGLYASFSAPQARIHHVHRKIFLPTYGVFDEQRFVQPGHSVRAFDTAWGRAAIVICEDAWHSLVPTLAALDGAQILFVPSASPARGVKPARVSADVGRETLPSSLERWEMVARSIAAEHGVFVCMCQLVGFEGGKGFPGASLVAGPDGDVLARGPLFEESIVLHRCHTADISRTRAAAPMLADLRRELPHLLYPEHRTEEKAPAFGAAGRHPISPKSIASRQVRVDTAPTPPDPLAIDGNLVAQWLVAFLRDEVIGRRGFQKGIVGLSGGVDSSLTAHLAVRALGNENVIGVRMPYSSSSEESLTHAELVATQLGIQLDTVDISAAVDGYAGVAPDKPNPTRLGNVMARIRMTTLFDLSAAFDALPLGTGNKTERLLGYFTWHADDSPPVNPLGDLLKTQVWALARHVGVPEEIVSKPATADLIRGQTDEEDLGVPYLKADLILHWLLQGLDVTEIVARGYNPDEVAVINRRLSSTHWKRRLPTVAMVSQSAIGEYYLRPVDY
jgi:NAD+ synthetase